MSDKRNDTDDLDGLPDFMREAVEGAASEPDGAGDEDKEPKTDDVDAPEGDGAPSETADAPAAASSDEDPDDEIPEDFSLGHDAGGEVDIEHLDLEDEPEQKSRFGLVLTIFSLLVLGGGLFFILGNASMREQVMAFFSGDIARHKMMAKQHIEEAFKEMNNKTKPYYGDVTLTYYPQDAKVSITESIKHFDTYKAFRSGQVTRTEDKKIPNQTETLKPGEIVTQLPLNNLPVMTREFYGPGIKTGKVIAVDSMEGADVKVQLHSYKISIEKIGYKTREFEFAPGAWQKIGPAVNAIITFQGADLEPEPETMKANFIAAMKEMHCVGKHEKDRQKKMEMEKEIQIRHHFKTTEEFDRIHDALTQDTAWWTKAWKEEIDPLKCPKP